MAASLFVLPFAAGGCFLPQLIGGMAQSAQREGSTEYPAEYEGLRGKTWAVVVLADRPVQSEVTNVVTVVANATTNKLLAAQGTVEEPGPLQSGGFLPAQVVRVLQVSEPTFEAWTYARMAEELGVERLIVIDIHHLQLFEPGNSYVWNGRIAAQVGVVEADVSPNDFAFSRNLDISYPDAGGYTQNDFSRGHVVNTLLDRLTNRAAWLFHEHETPNAIEY
jgi:hypothetical protein